MSGSAGGAQVTGQARCSTVRTKRSLWQQRWRNQGYVNFSKVKFFEIRRPLLPSRWALGDIEEVRWGPAQKSRPAAGTCPPVFCEQGDSFCRVHVH